MFMYTDYNQHLLDNVKKIHFIGCGGSGMYPLIQILAAKGYEISGSDVLDGSIIRYEREMGVKVSLGHSADNVIGADMVVYSAAISKDNVELNAAASYGIPTVERSVLLGYVSRLYKQSICVSGTHGKTTTTSMITTALELAGRDPSAVIGGKLPLINGYGKAGKGDDIVIESCEFAETFLKLTPYLSVVLNIDNDHLDYYGSMGELKFAFKRFALMTQFMIFANADDKNTMDVMYTLDRRVRTFGIENDGDYQAHQRARIQARLLRVRPEGVEQGHRPYPSGRARPPQHLQCAGHVRRLPLCGSDRGAVRRGCPELQGCRPPL